MSNKEKNNLSFDFAIGILFRIPIVLIIYLIVEPLFASEFGVWFYVLTPFFILMHFFNVYQKLKKDFKKSINNE